MQLTKLGVDSIVKVDNRTAGLPSFSTGEARRLESRGAPMARHAKP